MIDNGMKQRARSVDEIPLTERETKLEHLRQQIALTLGSMAAPISHNRTNGKVTFEIREDPVDSRPTFGDFEADYRKLGQLLEELRILREKTD